MDRIVKSYCLECEWTAWTDTVADRNGAVVEHYVETGHAIDSVRIHLDLEPPSTPQLN